MPNSTADKTKKKKVKDKKFRLSYKKPIERTITYKVIHSNSAVKSKCRAFETLNDILKKMRKNSRK